MDEETSTQIEKTKLEASLRALNLQKEVNAANAEEALLETAATDVDAESYHKPEDPSNLAIVKH